MVRDKEEDKSSFGQSTACTCGSAALCFNTKTLGPVVMLPTKERQWSNKSTEISSLMMDSFLFCGDSLLNSR